MCREWKKHTVEDNKLESHRHHVLTLLNNIRKQVLEKVVQQHEESKQTDE